MSSIDPVHAGVEPAAERRSARQRSAEVVRTARRAQLWWASIGFSRRRRILRRWATLLTRRAGRIAAVAHRELGKPLPIGLTELAVAVDQLVWAADHARRVLAPHRIPGRIWQPEYRGRLSYRPCGTVAVISPTDFPIFCPLVSAGYALAAGNTVILKPSPYAPRTAELLTEAFVDAVGPAPVLRVLHGHAAVGTALCSSGVDMVCFTGSAAAGRRVMAECADALTPVVLECGGKDAMIVDSDANVDAAAAAACFGAFVNSGQNCVGIERIYVVDAIYDDFLRRFAERAVRLTVGSSPYDDLGPLVKPERFAVLGRQIADAQQRGARVVLGGQPALRPPFAWPTILTSVPVDAAVMVEETPGPIATVIRVDDAAEALALANSADYGLGGAVFGRARAAALAGDMKSGMTSINSYLSYVTQPGLPFGGAAGQSGFGRLSGDLGLRSFTQPKSVSRRRFPSPLPVFSFDRDPVLTSRRIAAALRMRHGWYR